MLRRELRGPHEVDGQILKHMQGQIMEILDLGKAFDGTL
jgi:hypothetical protein